MSSSSNNNSNNNSFVHRQQQQAQMEEDQRRYLHTTNEELTPRGRLTPQPHSRPLLPPIYNHRAGIDRGVSRPYILPAERRTFRARINSDRILDRYRHNAHERSSSSPQEFHRAANQLDAASSTSRALLDDPNLNMTPPSLPSQSTGNDSASETEPSHRFKRRKLDTDKQPTDFKGFSYGYYGQVVPGQLTMEIVSCDGGSFESDSNIHAAENVLKDDDSVYCTKANRCNLILRHQGATPFCLEELVIKAPPQGYTAPVQEGMVFVSMTSDDLLARTARYQIQYSSPKRSRRRSSEERSTELAPIISIRHNGDGTVSTQQFRSTRQQALDEEEDDRHAQVPSDFAVLNCENFTVTTECSDDEEDDEDEFSSSAHGIRRRYRGRHYEEEVAEDHDDETPWHLVESYSRPPRPPRREFARRETPSQITLAEAVEASQIATQEAMKAVGGYMAAHARFFIEKNKSKCTIKFDPPISGRFILLKMWSPRRETNKNIDIKHVVARGYAGPRLFPAQQLR